MACPVSQKELLRGDVRYVVVHNNGREDSALCNFIRAAFSERRHEFQFKARLIIFGEHFVNLNADDAVDVIVFPDAALCRGLKKTEVESFLDQVLVQGKAWPSSEYVCFCAIADSGTHCGVCGPNVFEKLKEGVDSLTACARICQRKFTESKKNAGTSSKAVGDWFGYMTPDDVPELLELYMGKGDVIQKDHIAVCQEGEETQESSQDPVRVNTKDWSWSNFLFGGAMVTVAVAATLSYNYKCQGSGSDCGSISEVTFSSICPLFLHIPKVLIRNRYTSSMLVAITSAIRQIPKPVKTLLLGK